ncbi:type IV pilus major pilin [Vibrio cholerae]|uniref:Toxin co-regulated pilin n=2 Tax=Vibrio cholerae TaxID=666 RepID=B7TGW8_VIBCL|nr:type IV pilus major pilin [Vibrio cholerae]ACK75606.1 toxin co-regulated pilin [Vibrio cholerae]EGR2475240.1 type IV pilus major pilin [Vibrio cholerae]KFD82720.1 toxin coregulated pilin [Vibrio cholerae]GHZ60235.1 toxin co-regulated pilin [Vibrio cholerae]
MQLLKQLFKKKFVKEEHDKKTGQEGMTLLEVIIVLGIMGVVSAGVVTLAQRAIDSQNMTKAAQSLNSIQVALTQTYRGLGKYPTAAAAGDAAKLTAGLVSLGKISSDEAKNPFTGSDMNIFSFPRNSAADKAFAISVEGLTQAQCKTLITSVGDMFPYIAVKAGATSLAVADLGDFETSPAKAADGVGVIKSIAPAGVNLNLTTITHVEKLCTGDAPFIVAFGNS